MTNAKAPDAGQGIEGQTPKEGTQMNDTITVPQTPDIVHILGTPPTTTQTIVSKLLLAADLLDEVTALEADLAGGDENAFADAIRPHLIRIGVTLGDIPEDIGMASIRAEQFYAAAHDETTDVSMLTLGDISRLAKMDGITPDAKMQQFIEAGALSEGVAR